MSMKRSKAKSSGSARGQSDEDSNYFAKPKEVEKTWAEQMEGKGDDQFAAYSMASRFPKGQLVFHTKFGKGVVTHVEGARIEVLFEDGVKKLGHAG